MHGRRVDEPPPPPAPCQGVTLIRHLLNLKLRTSFLNAYCAVLNAFDRRGVFTQPDGTTYDGEFDSDCCQGNLVAIRWRLLTRLLSHFKILFSLPSAADIITQSHIHRRCCRICYTAMAFRSRRFDARRRRALHRPVAGCPSVALLRKLTPFHRAAAQGRVTFPLFCRRTTDGTEKEFLFYPAVPCTLPAPVFSASVVLTLPQHVHR